MMNKLWKIVAAIWVFNFGILFGVIFCFYI